MLVLPCAEATEELGSIICRLQAHKHSHTHPQIIFLRVDRMVVLGAERSKEYG